jgi:Uma2 family endonuclease
MVQLAPSRAGLSLEDYFAAESPFELWDGESIEKMPEHFIHFDLQHRLYNALYRYLLEQPLGTLYMEGTFILPSARGAGWVTDSRIPDLMFFKAGRIEAFRNQAGPQPAPLTLVPDLVIEILSTHDSYAKILQKVGLYLRDGVSEIWVIDPAKRQASLYSAEGVAVIEGEGLLRSPALLGEFALPLPDLFGA